MRAQDDDRFLGIEINHPSFVALVPSERDRKALAVGLVAYTEHMTEEEENHHDIAFHLVCLGMSLARNELNIDKGV